MPSKKKTHPAVKAQLHTRNPHRERYDFKALIASSPDLAPFVKLNPYGDESINFFDPQAVKKLNQALLIHYYQLEYWDIPKGFLCPPIPGRADYIHHLADLVTDLNIDKSSQSKDLRCLDVGVGANCVYPIIGVKEYGWSFIGSEIDKIALQSASKIVNGNTILKGKVELRLQENHNDIFFGILQKDEFIDITICNPPFYASLAEAQVSSQRKVKNLKKKPSAKVVQNFGGQNRELWCEGGEKQFIKKIIRQSKGFAKNCSLFSSLVSKEANLKDLEYALKRANAKSKHIIPMGQGNKKSRILAWSFLL